MESDAYKRLLQWSNRILDDPPMEDYWRSVWERGGKQRCVHCGRPIYCDDGPGSMSSGYYFHIDKTDGMNGLYCNAPFGRGKSAYPNKNDDADEKEVAQAVREFLNNVDAQGGR